MNAVPSTSSATAHADLASLLSELEAERALADEIRSRAKDLEATQRQLVSLVNRVHSTPASQVPDFILTTCTPILGQVRAQLNRVAQVVPENQFYKWNDLWSMSLQKAAYAVALSYYLVTGRLVTKSLTSQLLGLSDGNATRSTTSTTTRLHLTTEEYLHSLISMINDFSRLSVNAVTMSDFTTPLRLSEFVKDLSSGFSLLNLKNDSLRRRFDTIKYDVKKLEEVVYDISLRKLLPVDASPEAIAASQEGLGVLVDEQTRQQRVEVLLMSGEEGGGSLVGQQLKRDYDSMQ